MTYITTSPQVTQPEVRVPSKPSLESRIMAALEHARRLTAMYGTDNVEVAIAWETVEELQDAKANQRVSAPSAFAQYCATHPDAPECRIYED